MRISRWSMVVAIVLAFGSAGTTLAGEAVTDLRWYAGASIGPASGQDFLDSARELGNAYPSAYRDYDETAWAVKLFAGYQHNENLAFEAFYLATDEYGGQVQLQPAVAYFKDVKVNGFGAAVVGTVRLSDRFWGLGKIGLLRWNVESEVNEYVSGFQSKVEENGISPVFGLGVRYGLHKDVFLRWEVELYPNVGDKDTTGESDLFVAFIPFGIVLGF